MLIPVNPERLKKELNKAFDEVKEDKVRTQLAKLSSDLYYAGKLQVDTVTFLQYIFLTPEEIRLVLELVPFEGFIESPTPS